MKTGKEIGIKWITDFVFGLFGIICLLLFIFSIFETSRVNSAEQITYHSDAPLFHILLLICICAGSVYFRKRIRLRIPHFILYGIFFAVMVLWIAATCLYPKADQMQLMEICSHIAQKNYQDFLPGGYLYNQPHQIFMAYISAVFYRLFGTAYVFVFQGVNAAASAGIAYFLKNLYKKFEKEGSSGIFLTVCFLFAPFVLYVTFVYGTIIGLFFALAALDALWKYLEDGSVRHMVSCTVFSLLAQLLKSNYLIFLAGFAAVLIFDFLQNVNLRHIVFVCMLVFAVLLCSRFMTDFTENLTGVRSEGGIPKVLFLAMGLQESELAPGWWNGYHDNIFIHNEFDVEASREIGIRNIKKRVKKMQNDPSYAADFFLKKLLSEWSEPTYESIWIQQQRISSRPMPALVGRLIHNGGRLADAYVFYCNLFQSFLYFGALLFVYARWNQISSGELLIPVIFIGGFLFHIFWEAKGQYTLPYCISLLPCAVSGYRSLAERLERECGVRKRLSGGACGARNKQSRRQSQRAASPSKWPAPSERAYPETGWKQGMQAECGRRGWTAGCAETKCRTGRRRRSNR